MSEKSLRERTEFYGLERQSPADFAGVGRALKRGLGPAIDRFYAAIAKRPSLSSHFDGPQHIERVKNLQMEHWRSVFRDGVDTRFYDRSTKIGTVHARVGLETTWLTGGYALVLEELIMQIVAPGWTRYLPWRRSRARQAIALVKVSLLDIDLVLSSHFDDSAKQAKQVNKLVGDALSDIADGNLTAILSGMPEEYSKLERDFNTAVASLRDSMGAVVEGTEALQSGSSEIRFASEDLARRTEEQAANLEETAAAVSNATERIQNMAETTNAARDTIEDASERADDGAKIVSQAVAAMDQIEKSSGEINNIISVIESIAFQTNLLALNAGVEAARAGETGKGFAVVASEVRALAQRCSEAAEEVKALVTASGKQVGSGVELVNRSGEAFGRIRHGVTQLATSIQSIADATQAQAENPMQINTVVGGLDRSTQQNAAMAEQCTAAATSLSSQADKLGNAVAGFETNTDGSASFAQPPARMAA